MQESISLNWWQLGIGLGVLAILAALADWMKSRVLAKAIGKVASETRIPLDSGPFDKRVLARLAPIVPALVVYYGIVPALGVTRSEATAGAEAQVLILFWTVVRRLSAAYIALTIARTLVAVADSFSAVYHRTSPVSMAKPIKSYVQIVTLIVYSIAGVVIVAILVGRSPVVFLSGVGGRGRGSDAGLPQHPRLARSEHPDHLQRHGPDRRLGGDPARRRRRNGG